MQIQILSGRDCNLFVVFGFFIVFGDVLCCACACCRLTYTRGILVGRYELILGSLPKEIPLTYAVGINGCYVFVFSGTGGRACAIQMNRTELYPSPHEICSANSFSIKGKI